MKILVITGSPHRNGSTDCLASRFIKGAEEAGHEVVRFDAAFGNIHPCTACEHCHSAPDAGCVFKDAMEGLNPDLLSADAVVLVSPVYYYAVSAQLKAVVDRFYANDKALHGGKKAALILAMGDDDMKSAEGPRASFRGMCGWLGWDIAGEVVASSSYTREDVLKTEAPRLAYELGLGI